MTISEESRHTSTAFTAFMSKHIPQGANTFYHSIDQSSLFIHLHQSIFVEPPHSNTNTQTLPLTLPDPAHQTITRISTHHLPASYTSRPYTDCSSPSTHPSRHKSHRSAQPHHPPASPASQAPPPPSTPIDLVLVRPDQLAMVRKRVFVLGCFVGPQAEEVLRAGCAGAAVVGDEVGVVYV